MREKDEGQLVTMAKTKCQVNVNQILVNIVVIFIKVYANLRILNVSNVRKRIGHIAKVFNVNRNFNFVEKDIEVDYLYHTDYANVDRTKENVDSHFEVVLEIDNKHHKFIFDSGASIFACDKESYINMFSNYRLHQDNTILRGYNGNTFIPGGYFKAVVKYNSEILCYKRRRTKPVWKRFVQGLR